MQRRTGRSRFHRSVCWGGLALCLALAAAAQTSAVQPLGAHLQTASPLRAYAGYSVATRRLPNQIVVREYVAPSGEIFAIAWQGPGLPDLRQLLGARFAAFQQAAARSARRRRGPLYVQVGSLVVENAGTMRGFHGRAYLLDRLPAHLTAAVIR